MEKNLFQDNIYTLSMVKNMKKSHVDFIEMYIQMLSNLIITTS
jgi:hypothetical protein